MTGGKLKNCTKKNSYSCS